MHLSVTVFCLSADSGRQHCVGSHSEEYLHNHIVSHRSQPHQQSSQPQRTLLQHVAQSQTATQTSVVVKSIPASSTGAITHIMQQVVPFLLQTVCKTAVGYVNDAGAGFVLNECVAVIGKGK